MECGRGEERQTGERGAPCGRSDKRRVTREKWAVRPAGGTMAGGTAGGGNLLECLECRFADLDGWETNRTKGNKKCGRTAAGLPECETACKRKTSVNTPIFHNLTHSVAFTSGGAASCRARAFSKLHGRIPGGASTPCEPFRPGRTTILVVRENSARDAPGVGSNGGRRVSKGSRGGYSNVSNAASRTWMAGRWLPGNPRNRFADGNVHGGRMEGDNLDNSFKVRRPTGRYLFRRYRVSPRLVDEVGK